MGHGVNPKTAATNEEWNFAPIDDVLDGLFGPTLEINHRELTAGTGHINKVVRGTPHFAARDFASPDIQVAIDLAGVSGNDLAVEFFGQADRKL